ncbi:MAG: hypothetical protein ABJN84_05475 [Flavobacteriaceae bacterium]
MCNNMVLLAHQPDLSTTMLMERENGQWVLQLSAALTAFQHEIKMNYPAYKSPQEFREMVLQHLKKNLNIYINETGITLENGQVKLGHQTNVIFEVQGIPNHIDDVLIQNKSFKNIHGNQNTLLILKNGFKKKQFVLNNANDHTVWLEVNNNSFVMPSENAINHITLLLVGMGIGVILIGAAFLYFRTQDQKLKLVLKNYTEA